MKRQPIHANLLILLFIAATLVVGTAWFGYHAVERVAARVDAVHTSNAQAVAAINNDKATVALEPQIRARFAALARIDSPTLVREHQHIVRCAGRLQIVSYSLSIATTTITLHVVGTQNDTLRFLDCLDTLPITLSPTSITIAAQNKAISTTYNGTLLHA